MKMRSAASLLFGVILILFSEVNTNAQDEAPGSQLQITVPIPTGNVQCGRATNYFYCYGIPASTGGNFWVDTTYSVTSGQIGAHFIEFSGVADLGQATVTSVIATYTTFHGYQVVSAFDITFNGQTTDDGGTYTGTGHFELSYYYGSCSGRGCGIPISKQIQSGNLTITYN